MQPTRIAAFVLLTGLGIVGLVGASLATHDEIPWTGGGSLSADEDGAEMNGDLDIGTDDEDGVQADLDEAADVRADVDLEQGSVDVGATGEDFDVGVTADVDEDVDASASAQDADDILDEVDASIDTNLDDEDAGDGVDVGAGIDVGSADEDGILDDADLQLDLRMTADAENGIAMATTNGATVSEADAMAAFTNGLTVDADDDRLALAESGSGSLTIPE